MEVVPAFSFSVARSDLYVSFQLEDRRRVYKVVICAEVFTPHSVLSTYIGDAARRAFARRACQAFHLTSTVYTVSTAALQCDTDGRTLHSSHLSTIGQTASR